MRASAGILPYHLGQDGLYVFIAHMGGPLWASKDAAAWTMAKGEYQADAEQATDAARREFSEEIGSPCPPGELVPLGEVRTSGKRIAGFAVRCADRSLRFVSSNTFEMVWPPKSGTVQSFPEIDRAQWCTAETASRLLVKSQRPLLESLSSLAHGTK